METLGDDLVLLSVNPDSGRIRTKQKIGFGLMGAELVGLAAAGRVDIEGGRVVVRDAAATGDPRLDAALASLARSRRPPKPGAWVSQPRRKILNSYLERLVAAGCLHREGKVLARWRIDDPGRAADARARLDAVAAPAGETDLAQTALGGLAYAIGLVKLLYPGRDNRAIRKRFQQLADGQPTPPPRSGAPDLPDLEAATSAAADAAHHAAAHAATHAATHAAVHAATHAAVHAATHAASDAGHAAAAGGHGGH